MKAQSPKETIAKTKGKHSSDSDSPKRSKKKAAVKTPKTSCGGDKLSLLASESDQKSIIVLLPYLSFEDLARFYQLNRACKAILTPTNAKCIKFDVLFAKQKHVFISANWQELLALEIQQTLAFGKILIAI